MCRMVGVVFRNAFPWEMLSDLRHVSEVGKVPDQGDEEDGHRDGWGMVSFRDGSPLYLGRSPRPIHIDPSFESSAKAVPGLERPNILICHARRGTEGERSMQNTHPFTRDGIVFAHNGSVKEFHPETRSAPKGTTDSERLFLLFMDRYAEMGDVRGAIKSVLEDDVHDHEFTGLVFMISDGKHLYGYREYGPGRDEGYYNLRFVPCADAVALFQETRLTFDRPVTQVENGELVQVGLDLDIRKERLS